MILKTIAMQPAESTRRAMVRRFNKLLDAGKQPEEIAAEMNIPVEEIYEAIEWAKQYGPIITDPKRIK